MTIRSLETRHVGEQFLLSEGFASLCSAMQCIDGMTTNETVGAIAQVAVEDFVMTFAKGGRGGCGIRIARESNVRISRDGIITTSQGFPQLDLQGGRQVEQVAMQFGEQSLSSYLFPAHEVVEDSARVMAASLQKVNEKNLATPDLVDAILLMVQYGGGVRFYERPYKGRWGYKAELSKSLRDNLNHSALLNAMFNVS